MLPCNMKYSISLFDGLQQPGDSLHYKTGRGITGCYYHDPRGLRFKCTERIDLREFKYIQKANKISNYVDFYITRLSSICDGYYTSQYNNLIDARFKYLCNQRYSSHNVLPTYCEGSLTSFKKYLFIKRKNHRFF